MFIQSNGLTNDINCYFDVALGVQEMGRPLMLLSRVSTNIGDAFRSLSKCKCDENMFWCQSEHKTYSMVLMYIL